MTMAMENYMASCIAGIIRDSENPEEVRATVEDKFGEVGLSYLENIGYPEE